MIQEIIFLGHKKVHYKPEKTVNAFSSNYIEYRSNRDKDKALSIILMKLNHIWVT